ncbi:MAG: DUF2834 domain-containing protein [Cyclobacteriaceae bacterium]
MNFKKYLYLALAILSFCVFQFGMIQWINSEHSFSDLWSDLVASSWLLKITLIDGGIFAIICLVWMIVDFKTQSLSKVMKVGAFLLTVAFGAAGFFLYLAIRRNR